MKEADVLADRIAVLVEGSFKCLGPSLSLKNQFGDGYKLNIVCEKENVDFVQQSILSTLKEAKLSFSDAGCLTFSTTDLSSLKPFFKLIGSVSH